MAKKRKIQDETWYSVENAKGIQFFRRQRGNREGPRNDFYYRGHFQVAGKKYFVSLGWESEGCTLDKAIEKRNKFMENTKKGVKPRNLKEEVELAQQQAREAEEEKARLDRLKVTFASFFENTYFPQAKADKKPNSWRKEESFFNNWINPAFGHKLLKNITPTDLEELKASMNKEGLTDRTIQYCLAVIRQIFNRAIALDMFEGKNPVSKIKMPSPNNKRTRFLTWTEAQNLLTKLKEHSLDLHDQALMALHCGLRAGEILKLTWANLDFDQGIIHIRDTKSNRDRYVYMTEQIKDMLRTRQNKAKSNELIFPDRKGKQRENISKVFSEVVNTLSLNSENTDSRDKVCFHTLRHTFASWQVQAGMSLYELQKLLGHESFAMVQRYAHLSPENMRKATAIFDQENKAGKVLPLTSA